MLGFEFGARGDPYAVFNVMQGLSVFVFDLIQGRIDVKRKEPILVYTAIMGVFSLICNAATLTFKFREDKK